MDGQIIRVFDEMNHHIADKASGKARPGEVGRAADRIDPRWVKIRRPEIIVGGELTMRNLDLIFDPISKTYEAPLQMKANNGLFVIDDFGRQGESPSYPRLLDRLAVEWIESEWNVKHLMKLMVMSRAYQQSSRETPHLREADPENRWVARQSRFRLPAEMIRDNALAISGLFADPDVALPSAVSGTPGFAAADKPIVTAAPAVIEGELQD